MSQSKLEISLLRLPKGERNNKKHDPPNLEPYILVGTKS